MSEFKDLLKSRAQTIELALDTALPAVGPNPLAKPMRHAVMGGGKRIRGFLVLETAKLFNVNENVAAQSAAAIECMHGYSLIHDDLPCMDNDDMRRGKPTVHVQWDEATAVLAGDALQAMAFELISGPSASPRPDVRSELVLTLAKAAGARGMVLGQALDIAAESAKKPLTIDEITNLQMNKTGALIEWAACCGAVLAKQSTIALKDYARAIGLAFQIQDDILDVSGDAKKAGKKLKKDEDAGKATFVSLLGLEGATKRASDLVDEACEAVAPYSVAAEPLRQAARFVIERDM